MRAIKERTVRRSEMQRTGITARSGENQLTAD